MTTNVSFALLDAAVIAGRGDDPLVGPMSHARLLEEVAALGGVMRHLGVGRGVPVVIDVEDDLDAVVGALATARIGGVATTADDPVAPVVLASSRSGVPSAGRLRLVRGDGVREPDLDWAVMLRAGRTDPASCEVLEPGAPFSPGRTVAEEIAVLAAAQAPYDAAELRGLLQV